MQPEAKCPTFFAEISCLTSPVPGVPFLNDGPRIALVGKPIEGIQFSVVGEEPLVSSPYLRIRELELIVGYHNYIIKVGEERHFISFRRLSIAEPLQFYNYAAVEVARINRILNSLFPIASEVRLEKTVCISDNETSLRPCWENDSPIGGSASFPVVNDPVVFENWNAYLRSVVDNRPKAVFELLDLELSNPIVAACVALISQNSFPSFYNVFEIIAREYGGQSELIKRGPFCKREISDFTDSAQSARHANHSIGPNTRLLELPEAKLFIIRLLNYYIDSQLKL